MNWMAENGFKKRRLRKARQSWGERLEKQNICPRRSQHSRVNRRVINWISRIGLFTGKLEIFTSSLISVLMTSLRIYCKKHRIQASEEREGGVWGERGWHLCSPLDWAVLINIQCTSPHPSCANNLSRVKHIIPISSCELIKLATQMSLFLSQVLLLLEAI